MVMNNKRSRLGLAHLSIAMGLTLGAGGCYDGLALDDGLGSGPGGADSAGSGDTEGGNDSGNDTAGTDDDGFEPAEMPAPTTRFARLTHRQWENTVQDLLYLSAPTGLSDNFRADPAQSGYLFDNNAAGLEVDSALWSGYQRAASEVAVLAVNDPQIMSAITPPDAGDDAARADTFVREFGLRVFRRPLDEDEVAQYVGMFAEAPALYPDVEGFDAGVQMVIEAMLQSPHFLYRVERSTAVEGDVIRLDDFEVATRLSYFLWNSMPDQELFDLAEAGMLLDTEQVEVQARRMLEDPRARGVVEHFHDYMFETHEFEGIDPSEAFFPDAPATLGASAITELRMFVDEVVFGQEGSFADLLTSNQTFVNADLAAVYGLEGTFGTEFEPVELDPTQRKGLLTQVGFLANNASSVNPDPIHRGVFVSERVVCNHLPAPPDGVPPVPPPEGKSNRQTVEEHTEQDGTSCKGCHSTLINPFGFPFENYDALGAFRTDDAGFEVDPSATVFLGTESAEVANALELIDLLAQSERVHACYLAHWVEYAHGRPHADEDDVLVDRLTSYSHTDNGSVKDLLVELVLAKPFLTRATEELQ